jgi:pantoate kinase
MDSGESQVDIITLKSSKAAEQYRLSLQMYLNNPSLNPLIKSASIYAGNVSLSDMNTNDTTADNNYVSSPSVKNVNFVVDPDTNPFGV